MKILIIEDDPVIRDELTKYLLSNNYTVSSVKDFANVASEIEVFAPHLILLDVNLPFQDGYSICRNLRKISDTPVIILTSRDTEMDELMSMHIGADDFVRKPFNPQILLARIERLLNRSYQAKSDILECHNFKLNLLNGCIYYKEKVETLTKNELLILSYLIAHKGCLVSREDLMMHSWSSSEFIDDNTLSVNMTRLRKKLECLGIENVIETRRGLGYLLL